MSPEVRWEHMFRDQLEAAWSACPVLYLTYGLCEPHGPQNTLGLDTLKAHGLACEAARLGGGIVAPPDFWHIHETGDFANFGQEWIGEVERSWITAIPPWHHFKSMLYHLRSAEMNGFKAVILITGHYGVNWEDMKRLVDIAQPFVGARLFAVPDFELIEGEFWGETITGDHAGRVETSQLWALEPQCVDLSRLGDRDEPLGRFAAGEDAHEASRLEGERIIASQAANLARKAKDLIAEFDRLQPTHRLREFEAVERLWRDQLEPLCKSFLSFKNDPYGDGVVMDPGSQWSVNADIEGIWSRLSASGKGASS